MSGSVAAFERYLRAPARHPRTICVYISIIVAFFAFQGRDGNTAQMPTRIEIDAFLGRHRGRHRHDGLPRATATRNQELAALKVFAAFAMSNLGWECDPTETIAFVWEPPRIPPVLTANELQRCFCAISNELCAVPITTRRVPGVRAPFGESVVSTIQFQNKDLRTQDGLPQAPKRPVVLA